MEDYVSMTLSGETVDSQFTIDNPDEYLSAGQYAAVCTEAKRTEDVLLVPTNAVYSDASGYYVYLIEDGERIAQMVIARHEQVQWEAVEALSETERGTGGFGHTGV